MLRSFQDGVVGNEWDQHEVRSHPQKVGKYGSIRGISYNAENEKPAYFTWVTVTVSTGHLPCISASARVLTLKWIIALLQILQQVLFNFFLFKIVSPFYLQLFLTQFF